MIICIQLLKCPNMYKHVQRMCRCVCNSCMHRFLCLHVCTPCVCRYIHSLPHEAVCKHTCSRTCSLAPLETTRQLLSGNMNERQAVDTKPLLDTLEVASPACAPSRAALALGREFQHSPLKQTRGSTSFLTLSESGPCFKIMSIFEG